MENKSSIQDDNINNTGMSVKEWWNYCQDNNHWYLTGSKGQEVWERLNITDRMHPGQLVLNIGVGLGYCTQELVKKGCVVHVLDISEVALNRVRDIVVETWLPNQLVELPAATFDLVISHLVTQHMSDDDLFEQISAVVRSLKPEGIFAMQFAYALDGKYNLFQPNVPNMKAGGICRSLVKMNSLIEKACGRILWADRIDYYPEWNAGWYGIHIVQHDEYNSLLRNRSSESIRNIARLFNEDGKDLFNAGEGDINGAKMAFMHCLELDPELANAHNNLGVVYRQQANHEQALEHFKKAVSFEPENSLFVDNYAKLLESTGLINDIENLLDKYIQNNPDSQLPKTEEIDGQVTVAESKTTTLSEKEAFEKREKERLALYFYSTDLPNNTAIKNNGSEFLSDILKKPKNTSELRLIEKTMQVGGFFTENDSLALYRLSKQTPNDAKILEIGSYRGRSSNAIGHAIINSDRILYCIDTWTTFNLDEIKVIDPTAAPIAASYFTVFEDFLKNTSWFETQLRVMRGTIKGYSDLLPSDFFDLIFVDAYHDYINGCHDISVAQRCLKPGGIICGHDYWMDFPDFIEAVKEKVFSRSDLEEYGVVKDTYGFWFAKFKDNPPS